MRAVLDRITRDDISELVLRLCNISSPYGMEQPAAQFVHDWMKKEKFAPRFVALIPERPNVVGHLRGTGGGQSLIFNSHLDTAYGRPGDELHLIDPSNPLYHTSWIEGEYVYGEGVVNDKGPMAAFLIAAKAIREANLKLKGDLWLTAVSGEISQEPVDEFQGVAYLSKDLGARYMITHGGVVADYALVAEGTDFAPVWVEAGKAFFKVTLVYREKPIYTPFVERTEKLSEARNAVVRLAPFIEHFERWALEYEKRYRYECEGGTVVPRASINAVRGGMPQHMVATPQICHVYVDTRLAPGQNPILVREELESLLTEANLDGEIEMYLYRRGYEAQNIEPLRNAVMSAHRQIRGAEPQPAYSGLSSSWRDSNIFNELGIPTINYGPTRAMMKTGIKIDDLVDLARIYALVALDICQRERGSQG